jgi:hypothetical protein
MLKPVKRNPSFRLMALMGIAVMIAAVLAACGGRSEPTATPAPTAAPTEAPAVTPTAIALAEVAAPAADATATPGEEAAASAAESPLPQPISPLDQPTSPLATPTAIPAFDTEEGTGVVTGILLIQDENGAKPVANMIIALAETMQNDAGIEAVVAYDPMRSPQGTTDENGFFAIVDVPPGRYGFIMDTVITSYMLRTPGVDEDMLVDVVPGEQIDMGVLAYDALPIMGQQ